MSDIVYGHLECSSVIFNPMVNPETNEAVYSTMTFAKQQAKSMGMCCGALTFDQPLYLRANHIKYENYLEFKDLHIRLDGFHQLMSFLGAGCKLFEGAGLEELWGEVYARKTIM